MEGLINLVVCLLVLMILAVPLVFVYKYRAKIGKWIKEPTYGDLSVWDVDGIKRAERGVVKAQWKVEDAQDYLEWRKQRKQEEKEDQSTLKVNLV